MRSDRIAVADNWLNSPSLGDTYTSQGKPPTARRLHVSGAGALYLIPVDGGEGGGVLYRDVTVGETIDVQHDGIGGDSVATVDVVEF